jgi:hypothetical protein
LWKRPGPWKFREERERKSGNGEERKEGEDRERKEGEEREEAQARAAGAHTHLKSWNKGKNYLLPEERRTAVEAASPMGTCSFPARFFGRVRGL